MWSRPSTQAFVASSLRVLENAAAARGTKLLPRQGATAIWPAISPRNGAPVFYAEVTGKCDSGPVNDPGETREYDWLTPARSEYALIFTTGAMIRGLLPDGTQTANPPLSKDAFTTQLVLLTG